MADQESREVEASSPVWFRYLIRGALHFWNNHKLIGSLVIPFLGLVGAPVEVVGLVATIFVYFGHAHTVHKHGTRLWRRRRWLKWILIIALLLMLAVFALWVFGLYWLLSMLFQ